MDSGVKVRWAWLLVLFCGCSTPEPVMLQRVVIKNETSTVIRDVRVLHHPTNASGAVSAIQPGLELDLGLPRQALRAESATVTWTDRQGQRHNVSVRLMELKDRFAGTEVSTLIYTILPTGAVSAAIE